MDTKEVHHQKEEEQQEIKGQDLFIKPLYGPMFKVQQIDVKHDTVASLKSKIMDREGIQTGAQRLIINGKYLSDDKQALEDAGVGGDGLAVIHLLVRLIGGVKIVPVKVKTTKGTTLELDIDTSDQVESLKLKIHTKEADLVPSNQRVFYEGKELKDGHALEEYDIKEDAILDMKFQIFVKTLQGRSLVLTVKADDTVETIKEMIKEKEGMPLEQQRLIYGGKELRESMTVADYSMMEGSSVHLVMRLIG